MGTTVPSLSLSQGFCKPRDVKQNALKFETYIMPTIKEILLLLSLRLPGKAPNLLVLWLEKEVRDQAGLLGTVYCVAGNTVGCGD